jgi:outer membrane protein
MKIRLAIPVLAAVLAVPALWAQTSGARPADPVAASATKVGVINIQVAITNTAEGKQAAAELQSQFSPRQTELQNMQRQIEDIQTRLRTGATTLSDDEKARLGREGDQLARSFQRKQQDFQDDSNEAQREAVDRIGRKMIDVLDKYAKGQGYTIVLDTSSQTPLVLFASNQLDLTQEVIRLYDQTYPVKAGASAKPAAVKPATPKPATPPAPQATKPQ